MKNAKKAFTLIEVMVAVVIISVIIMALLQMYGNNIHIFSSLKKQTKMNEYTSFLIDHEIYGFENKEIDIYRLVDDFDLDTDLRKKLKNKNIKIIYRELEVRSLLEEEVNSEMTFEIGKSIFQVNDMSSSLFRIKIQ